jgi:hypothetical protein
MKNKIKKKLIRNCRNSFISMVSLILFFYGQSFAQWENTNLPSTARVNTLAIIDSNIFAGTFGDGIFVSTDNGENWVSVSTGLQSKFIHTIFVNDTNIFAGTETGASVSTDFGLNWSTINSGLSSLGVWSFAASNSTIFAGTWRGVYTSNNNGTNWDARGLLNTAMPIHTIIVNDEFIFAATVADGVFSSGSNGHEWDDISVLKYDDASGITELIPVYSLALIDTILIAGAGTGHIYYNNAQLNTSSFELAATFYAQAKPVRCFAIRNGNLFSGSSDGFISLSTNYGLRWDVIKPFLTHQSVYSLVLNDSYIFAGTGNGVWRLWYPNSITNVDNPKEAPAGFALEQNYPNPFNPVTTIKYSIPNIGASNYSLVQLKVYNLLGQEVAALVNEHQAPGIYEVKFDGSNLTSGIYIYKLRASSFISTKKLMLLK